jgi:iron complex transport system ATP-binding protein
VVAVIHDLSMAVRCFPRLILLDDGMVVGDGPSLEVLSVDTIKRVFRVQARFYQDQEYGAPLLWFPM